jgi:carbonic anhydrase/acetyltransferase-like protein (isoleucine patch superfamily)
MESANVDVGDNCYIQSGCTIISCIIKNGSVIGSNSVICEGSVIGENCIIAANSVVPPNSFIPDNTIFGGNPVKYIQETKKADLINMQNRSFEIEVFLEDINHFKIDEKITYREYEDKL